VARRPTRSRGDVPDALDAVHEFRRTVDGHIAALGQRLKALSGSPTGPVSEAVSAAAGVAASLYSVVRNE
jgi:hypothetical protein